jgi:MSHA biogenesis protein MshN
LSVINQMLKDLEQRQGSQRLENVATSPPVMVNKSSSKNILIIIVSVVITLFATYMVYLQVENQRLESHSEKKLKVTRSFTSTVNSDQIAIVKVKPEQSGTIEAKQLTQKMPKLSNNQDKSVITALASETPVESFSGENATNVVANPIAISAVSSIPVPNTAIAITSVVDSLIVEKSSQISPPIVGLEDLMAKEGTITKPKVAIAPVSTMEIKRKQLTPKALAKQKMSQAKVAVDNNDISKAEQLFEDVLLILPSEKGARKQLAALWFGRKSYQAALNLLSQGIALDVKDNELRLLKAQIHIKRQQGFAAFQVLQSHPALDTISDINYHSILANQAQGSKQYRSAISAYLRLIRLQQHVGRWWLGLGIAYDSNSQFSLAKKTYGTALNKHDLSSSARQFVSQRLQELRK